MTYNDKECNAPLHNLRIGMNFGGCTDMFISPLRYLTTENSALPRMGFVIIWPTDVCSLPRSLEKWQ